MSGTSAGWDAGPRQLAAFDRSGQNLTRASAVECSDDSTLAVAGCDAPATRPHDRGGVLRREGPYRRVRQPQSHGGIRQMVSTTNPTTSSPGSAAGETDLATTAKGIASDVADRAVAAAQRLPDAATATGAQLDRANQLM